MPDEFKDSEGKTALMNAIEDYEYSKVETLIQNGSDINFLNFCFRHNPYVTCNISWLVRNC